MVRLNMSSMISILEKAAKGHGRPASAKLPVHRNLYVTSLGLFPIYHIEATTTEPTNGWKNQICSRTVAVPFEPA